jgi:hypothetical protein
MPAAADVARAWVERWQASPALVAALPGGIHSDDLDANQSKPGGAPRDLPYAVLRVEPERPAVRTGSYGWWHSHRVTVELYGTHKAALHEAFTAVHAAFDEPARLLFPWAPAVVGHAYTRAGLASGSTPPPGASRRAYVWLVFETWLVVTARVTN